MWHSDGEKQKLESWKLLLGFLRLSLHFIYMCACTCEGACTLTEARGDQVCCFISLYFIPLRQGLSQNQAVGWWPKTSSCYPAHTPSTACAGVCTPGCYTGAGDLNSGPHAPSKHSYSLNRLPSMPWYFLDCFQPNRLAD